MIIYSPPPLRLSLVWEYFLIFSPPKMFYNSQAQIRFTLVTRKFANMSLSLENHRFFAKIRFFRKIQNTCPVYVVWAEESKTGLGYEIGPSQQKCQRKLSLQSMPNPAVRKSRTHYIIHIREFFNSITAIGRHIGQQSLDLAE